VIDYPAIYRLLTIGDPADMRGMSVDNLMEYERLSTVADRSPKPLRRWQAEAMPRALAALESSLPGVAVATTGAGKSVFLAELIRCWRTTHPDDVIVVTTPSVQLVEQLGTTLAEWLGPGIVGRYYTRAKQWKRPVVVACNASVPVLATVLAANGRAVSVWIADEAHKTATAAFLDEDRGYTQAEWDSVGARAQTAGAQIAMTPEQRADWIGTSGGHPTADVLQSARRLGLTATPFRSNVDERIGLFSEVVYRYSPADALRDGVIVPWRFVQADEEGKDVDAACIEMIRALGSRDERGPGVVDATSIEDATAYAATLTAAGIVARDGAKAAAIEALRTGQIDCIVHVSMLVEGVDLPWLRWGCFRRPVGARVRYIQHLGRYLRAFPGKTEAVILDPCGLEQRFRVTYEEALGWQPPAEVEEVAEVEPEDDDPTKEAPDKEAREVLTARVHSLALYVRRLTGALVAEGIAEKGDRKPGSWRNDPPSDKQRSALAKMVRVSARLGPAHRAALGRLSGSPVLTKGLASDVFDLLQAVRGLKGGEVWTPAVPVPVPADHVYEAPERPTFVGAALADGWAAVAIIADGDVLYQGARGQREGDTLEALYVRAEELARTTHGATLVRRAPGAVQAADRAIAAKVGAPMFRGDWSGVGG
jgi:superfamily II DNA or RNA helicase